MRSVLLALLLWTVVSDPAALAAPPDRAAAGSTGLSAQTPTAEQQKQDKINEFHKNRSRIDELTKRLDGDEPMSRDEVRNAQIEKDALISRQSQLRIELRALGVENPMAPPAAVTTGGGGAVTAGGGATSSQPPFAVPSFNTQILRDAAADVEKAQKALQDATAEQDPVKRNAATSQATIDLVFAEMKLTHLAAGPIGGGLTKAEAEATEPISENNAEISRINERLKELGEQISSYETQKSEAQAIAGTVAPSGAGGTHLHLVNRFDELLKPLLEEQKTLDQRRVALQQQNDRILIGIANARLASGVSIINQRLETENKSGRFTLHGAATGNEQRLAESRFLDWLYTAPGSSFGRPPTGTRSESFIEGVDTKPLDSEERSRLGAQAPSFQSTTPVTGFARNNSGAGNPLGSIASPINIVSNPSGFNFAPARGGGNTITITQRMIAEPDESILDEIDGVLVIAANDRQRAMPPSIARSAWAFLARLTAPPWATRAASVRKHGWDAPSREIWLAPLARGQGGSVASGVARIVFKSLGTSTGEAFEMTVVNDGPKPIRLDPAALVLEPLKNDVQKRIQQEVSKAVGRATTLKMNGYCLEFLKAPPTPGAMFRIADHAAQQEFAPARQILNATRILQKAGALKPDSNPLSYFHSIRQWAIWAKEQQFDMKSFSRAFVEHTKKNLREAGRQWTQEAEKAVMAAVPGRWSAIAQILQEAGRQPR